MKPKIKTIAYYRVSTQKQGQSGLGLEVQQQTIRNYLGNESPIAEYQEVESGRKTDRPELRKALEHCQRIGARLCIAKVDRLARNAKFLLGLLDSNVPLVFCDVPEMSGPSGILMVQMMASFAEFESRIISERTRAALKAAKARGVKLGAQPGNQSLKNWVKINGLEKAVGGIKKAADCRAEVFRSTVTKMVSSGLGNTAIARTLNSRGERSVCGGTWNATGIRILRARLAA